MVKGMADGLANPKNELNLVKIRCSARSLKKPAKICTLQAFIFYSDLGGF